MSILKKITLLWLPIAFFIVSCAIANDGGETIAAPPLTIAATALPISTETLIPTLGSPSPTFLPVIPTLPEEEAYHLLFDLLDSDDTCELPCWLNITPGKSSLDDVYSAWAPLQGITATFSDFPVIDKGNMDFIYKKDNYNLKIFTNYSVSRSTKVVESIDVSTEATLYLGNDLFEYAYTAEIYKNALSKYLLPNVLSTYGHPDQILIDMEIIVAEPTSPDFFHIWLMYPTRGVIIEYTGSAEVTDDTIHGCPSDTVVSLWLVSPENTELYQNTLEEATGLPASPYYKSTVDAVSMTVDEFYNEFKEPSSTCIESPLDIWPKH